jgi:hypothetical protein
LAAGRGRVRIVASKDLVLELVGHMKTR